VDGGSSGGSHSAKVTAPRGEASSVTAVTGSPTSRDAVPAGSPEVAEARTNVGELPYRVAARRSRRRTWATCEPKTPRYVWHSSTTTYASRRRKVPHRACPGSSA
jgi:hypothetical protein